MSDGIIKLKLKLKATVHPSLGRDAHRQHTNKISVEAGFGYKQPRLVTYATCSKKDKLPQNINPAGLKLSTILFSG